MQLNHLAPGTRFRVKSLGLTGTLIKANDCRARVKVDGATDQHVAFVDKNGVQHEFTATKTRETDWTPTVNVEVIRDDGEDSKKPEFDWFED